MSGYEYNIITCLIDYLEISNASLLVFLLTYILLDKLKKK